MDEYIARDAVHCMMVGLTKYVWTSPVSTESHVTVDADDVNFGVDKIPAADVAPVRHGQWIPVDGGQHKCRCCHTVRKTDVARDHYCPSCGAKMDGKVGDNA